MIDFFVSNMWGVGFLLFGPILYLVLNIIKIDQNLIGFIFSPFIFLTPIIGIYMIINNSLSKEALDVLSIIGYTIVVLLIIWIYFSDKRKKALDDIFNDFKNNLEQNNIDKALEIVLSLPDSFYKKRRALLDLSIKATQSDINKALTIAEFIIDTKTQSFAFEKIAELVSTKNIDDALAITDRIKEQSIKQRTLEKIFKVKEENNT